MQVLKPCPQDEDYFFLSVLLCFFFTSPLNNFCHFFLLTSSVSLDCIWNYRSSYHSLKRLVCPAMCILAVLSNPLVQTLSLSISLTNRSHWIIDCYYCLYVYMQKTASAPFSFLLSSPRESVNDNFNFHCLVIENKIFTKKTHHVNIS